MRRVGIIVDADIAPFSKALGVAAGEAVAFKRTLDSLGKEKVEVDVRLDRNSIRNAQKDVGGIGDSARKTSAEIDQLSGRLRVVGDLLAIFGPALAPIGAIAVPAVTGLANQLGFAAAAGGTALLAFQGVGDAVTAMNEAALEPTAENLLKVEQQLSRLSPEAAEFARGIGDMRDTFVATRDAAAEGLFPELTPALDDLEGLLGRVQPILTEIGSATGEMLADGLGSLNSDRWQGFFDFLEAEAKPTLTELGQTAGDFAHGLAEMWMAFQPLNSDFSGWLRDVASGFDGWASGLAQTEGFNDFIAYIRDNGPQVADTMGALGSALVSIVTAAAPFGGPVLAGIEAFAKVISTIADSPAGPAIIGLASAMALLNRAMAVQSKVAAGGFFGTTSKNLDKVQSSLKGASAGLGGFRSDLGLMSREYDRAGRAQSTFLSAMSGTTGAAQRTTSAISKYGAVAGKAAAGVGALAVATADTENSLGVQNTAMLGLAGLMLGPWGAAVGAGVGAVMDFAAANDDLEGALRGAEGAIASNSMAGMQERYRSLAKEISSTEEAVDNFWLSTNPGEIAKGLGAMLGDGDDKARVAAQDITDLSMAMHDLGAGMNLPQSMLTDVLKVAEHAAPALDALGITYAEMLNAFQSDPLGNGAWGEMQTDIANYLSAMDSGPARTRAFADSVADLGREALLTADTASAMGAALDALLSPTLNAEEATHAWRETLANLRNELDSDAGFGGFSKVSRENAAATRDVVSATQEMLVKRAEAGAGEREIAGLVNKSRQEFIRNGMAAGFSREAITKRANALGLTPKLVRTVFQAAGIGPVEAKARSLRGLFGDLPKKVKTEIKAEGVPRTVGEVDELVRKYNLTPKERTTLLKARNLAEKDYNAVLRGLGLVDKQRPNPNISANNRPALGAITTTQARLNALGGMNPTPNIGADDNASGTINYVRSLIFGLPPSRSTTLTTVHRTILETVRLPAGKTLAASGFGSAEGNIFRSVRSYANGGLERGDVANRHLPELAGPGPMRVWREPETKGEAYLPLANDFRRARAKALTEQVVDHFGGEVQWYAKGGISKKERDERAKALRSGIREFNPDPDDGVASIKREIREFKKALKDAHRPWTKAMGEQARTMIKLSKNYTALNKDLEKAREYQAEVAGKFTNDAFGNGLAGLQLQLDADTNDAQAMNAALKAAERLGLDGSLYKALAASGDLNTAQQIGQLSRSEIAALEKQYVGRDSATRDLGATAAREVYGRSAAEFTRAIDKLEKRIDQLPARIEAGAARGTERGSQRGANRVYRDRNVKVAANTKTKRR